MFQRIAALCLLLVFLFVGGGPVWAISWDDGGADKLWTTGANWLFGNNPHNQPVTIGNLIDAQNDTTLVDQFYEIDSLALTNGADVVLSPDGGTTSYALQVHGNVFVSGGLASSDSVITLYDGPGLGSSLFAETMEIGSNGRVILDSISAASPELAILRISDGLLDVTAGTSGGISGNGLIRLTDTLGGIPTTLLRNDGIIAAGYVNSFVFGTPPPATTLQVTATDPQARFDWDGFFDAGTLQVNGNATLDIDVQPGNGILFDAFDGFMNLSTGSTIDIAHLWTFGVGSGSGSGEININTQSFAIVAPGQDPAPGPAAHIAGSNWTMVGGTINIGDTWDTLQFDSAVSATGGTIENSGTMIFNANASFGSGVDFNMNGSGTSLIVNAGVNIATPDFNLDGASPLGDETTTINSGGVLNLGLGAGADEDFDHTINLNGGTLQVATIDNDWSLSAAGEVNVAGGGTSLIAGEAFHVDGNIGVTGSSTLNVDAQTTFNSLADVFIQAGSVLNLSSATYNGGGYTGGGILKKGNATISSDTTWDVAIVDLDDGTTAVNADLTINAVSIDDTGDGMDSTIIIDDLATLTVNMSGGEWTVDAPGTIIYNGNVTNGTFLDGSTLNLNGTIENHGNGQMLADLNIGSTAVVDIVDANRSIQLFGDTTVAAGATFTGDGKLYNVVNRTLRLLDGAGVDVLIENEGILSLGNSPGQTSARAYIQTNQGTWDLEIGGTGLNDFDNMILSETGALDGTLDISLIMGFAPSLGDSFSFLTAVGGVTGMFASILQPAGMPTDLKFDVNYFGSIAQLQVVSALSGDYNQDGVVDAADYTVWLDSLGQSGAGLIADANGNGNGVVDQADYDVWKANFGNSLPAVATAASVPEPSTLLLVGLVAGLGLLGPSRKRVDALRR